jgi:hypothetical protein
MVSGVGYTKGNVVKDGQADDLDVHNAWFRIQETEVTNTYAPTCKHPDSTNQIGCLVQASGCSMGYAGMSATQISGAQGLYIDDVAPVNTNIEYLVGICSDNATLCNDDDDCTAPDTCTVPRAGVYPFARWLWANSIVGTANIPANESPYTEQDQLRACFEKASIMNAVATQHGFVPTPLPWHRMFE